jgi:hypothetical protein
LPEAGWRFSLRSGLWAVTYAALLCGAAVLVPTVISHLVAGMAWIAATGWLATGVLFARGDQRAFCVGGAMAVAAMWTGEGGHLLEASASLARSAAGLFIHNPLPLGSGSLVWLKLLTLAAAAVGNGLLCVRARRYFVASHTNGESA